MIAPIVNLYEVQFPLYVTRPLMADITDISITDNYIKNFHVGNTVIPYDMILNIASTYLGRYMVLQRLELDNVIKIDYSFTNLAHLIYARPRFHKDSLIIDNRGQLRKMNKLVARGTCRRYSHRKGSYIFVRSIPQPLQIPQFPLLLDSLDTYKPYLEVAEYFNSYFFKNILPEGVHPDKKWNIQIM